jgi:hypothetical protein
MSLSCECCILSATARSLVQRLPTECDVSEEPHTVGLGTLELSSLDRTESGSARRSLFRVHKKKYHTKLNHWLEQLLLSSVVQFILCRKP